MLLSVVLSTYVKSVMIRAVDNQHNVGVGEGTIKKKIAEEYFRSATSGQPPPPPPKKKKKNKNKVQH